MPRLKFGRALALALGLGGVLAGCSSGNGAGNVRPPLPTPTPVGLQTPSGNAIYLGIYAAASHSTSDITTLEGQIGRKFAMDMHYDTWTTNFPATDEAGDVAAGRLPINSWNCSPTNAQIAAGDADLLIQTRGLALKSYGRPVFLRYLWDMNAPTATHLRGGCYDPGTDNADGTFSSIEFVAAWQRMHTIFATEHVTNVIWVWSPSAATGTADPTPYYPGDAYVDWVGVDAYDTTGQGFSPTFASIYPTLARFNKPILVGETGEIQSAQPAFFAQAGPALQTQFPMIRGIVYYDATAPGEDWRLTPSGITALAAFGAEPYVSATPLL
jgi:hypothetical protein